MAELSHDPIVSMCVIRVRRYPVSMYRKIYGITVNVIKGKLLQLQKRTTVNFNITLNIINQISL
jgi:hypothetical protein